MHKGSTSFFLASLITFLSILLILGIFVIVALYPIAIFLILIGMGIAMLFSIIHDILTDDGSGVT